MHCTLYLPLVQAAVSASSSMPCVWHSTGSSSIRLYTVHQTIKNNNTKSVTSQNYVLKYSQIEYWSYIYSAEKAVRSSVRFLTRLLFSRVGLNSFSKMPSCAGVVMVVICIVVIVEAISDCSVSILDHIYKINIYWNYYCCTISLFSIYTVQVINQNYWG